MTLLPSDKISTRSEATVRHALTLLAVDSARDLSKALAHAESAVPLAYENERLATYQGETRGFEGRLIAQDEMAQWDCYLNPARRLRDRVIDGEYPNLTEYDTSQPSVDQTLRFAGRLTKLVHVACYALLLAFLALLAITSILEATDVARHRQPGQNVRVERVQR